MLFLVASLACTLFYFVAPASTSWLQQTYGQIAISFASLAVLSPLIFEAAPKLRGLGQKFSVPRAIRDIALLGFVVSAVLNNLNTSSVKNA